jgi:hypothetical protein
MLVKTLIKKLKKFHQNTPVMVLGNDDKFYPMNFIELEQLSMIDEPICKTTDDHPQKWAVLLRDEAPIQVRD